MKRFALILLAYAAVLVIVACLLPSCSAMPPLEALVSAAVADGQVTPAEVQQIQSALPQSFDWGQAVAIGGSILGSILGVKVLPSSILRGPWDRPQPPQPPTA